MGEFYTSAKFFCLFLHVSHQLRAGDSFRETWEVFYFSGGGKLAAGLCAGEDERGEICAGCIDGGCVSGRAGSYDNDVFHIV